MGGFSSRVLSSNLVITHSAVFYCHSPLYFARHLCHSFSLSITPACGTLLPHHKLARPGPPDFPSPSPSPELGCNTFCSSHGMLERASLHALNPSDQGHYVPTYLPLLTELTNKGASLHRLEKGDAALTRYGHSRGVQYQQKRPVISTHSRPAPPHRLFYFSQIHSCAHTAYRNSQVPRAHRCERKLIHQECTPTGIAYTVVIVHSSYHLRTSHSRC